MATTSPNAAVTIAETIPFVVILILELVGPDFVSQWNSVYKAYKDEDDIEHHVPSEDEREAIRKSLRNYARYTFDYNRTEQYLLLTVFLLVVLAVVRLRNPSLLETICVLLTAVLTFGFWYASRKWFDGRSPHDYDDADATYLGLTIGELSVVVSNGMAIAVILLTS